MASSPDALGDVRNLPAAVAGGTLHPPIAVSFDGLQGEPEHIGIGLAVGELTDGWDREFHAGPPFMLHPAHPESLYGACIIELVDHVLAADRPYRICANETCGRLFSMQEGRSTSGGHRTERVKYHSTACKATQESREYRRRQADRRRKG